MAQYQVDPDKKFKKAINAAIKEIGDLTVPFQEMTREWFKGNRSIFDRGRKSSGQYDDLSPKYKIQKKKSWGFIYPILVASGHLSDSMTLPGHSNSINKIINKKSLVLGTNVTSKDGAPYGIFLQEGTSKMPARPYVLIGGEQVSPPEINRRREVWLEVLNDYVLQVSREKVG